MQVDAIGNQIQIDNLTDVLENISYQLTKNVEVLEADGQWLKAASLKENQYLKQNRHSSLCGGFYCIALAAVHRTNVR